MISPQFIILSSILTFFTIFVFLMKKSLKLKYKFSAEEVDQLPKILKRETKKLYEKYRASIEEEGFIFDGIYQVKMLESENSNDFDGVVSFFNEERTTSISIVISHKVKNGQVIDSIKLVVETGFIDGVTISHGDYKQIKFDKNIPIYVKKPVKNFVKTLFYKHFKVVDNISTEKKVIDNSLEEIYKNGQKEYQHYLDNNFFKKTLSENDQFYEVTVKGVLYFLLLLISPNIFNKVSNDLENYYDSYKIVDDKNRITGKVRFFSYLSIVIFILSVITMFIYNFRENIGLFLVVPSVFYMILNYKDRSKYMKLTSSIMLIVLSATMLLYILNINTYTAFDLFISLFITIFITSIEYKKVSKFLIKVVPIAFIIFSLFTGYQGVMNKYDFDDLKSLTTSEIASIRIKPNCTPRDMKKMGKELKSLNSSDEDIIDKFVSGLQSIDISRKLSYQYHCPKYRVIIETKSYRSFQFDIVSLNKREKVLINFKRYNYVIDGELFKFLNNNLRIKKK